MLQKAVSSRQSQEFKISRRTHRNMGSFDEQSLGGMRQIDDYYRPVKFQFLKENKAPLKSVRSYTLIKPKGQNRSQLPQNLEEVFSFEKNENSRSMTQKFSFRDAKGLSDKKLQKRRLNDAMKHVNISPTSQIKMSIIVKMEEANLLIEQSHPPLDIFNFMHETSLISQSASSLELTTTQINQTFSFINELSTRTAVISSEGSPDFFKGVCAFLVSVRGAAEAKSEEEKARTLLSSRESVREVTAAQEKHFLHNFISQNMTSLVRQYNQSGSPSDGSIPTHSSEENAAQPTAREQEVQVEVTVQGQKPRAKRGLAQKRSNPTQNSASKESSGRPNNVEQVHSYLDMYKKRKNANIDYAKFVTFGQPVFGYANHPLNRFLVKETRSSFQAPARSLKDTLELMRNYISP